MFVAQWSRDNYSTGSGGVIPRMPGWNIVKISVNIIHYVIKLKEKNNHHNYVLFYALEINKKKRKQKTINRRQFP